MISKTRRAALRAAALLTPFLALCVLHPHQAVARDGVSGCSIAEVETDAGRVWRYTIEVQVPEDGYCRVSVVEDKDRKSWKYCWLKRAADNPVSATCDDPLDDENFDVWKAKAVCGDQNSMAYCRRETPLVPIAR
jgi:hypothetical protein